MPPQKKRQNLELLMAVRTAVIQPIPALSFVLTSVCDLRRFSYRHSSPRSFYFSSLNPALKNMHHFLLPHSSLQSSGPRIVSSSLSTSKCSFTIATFIAESQVLPRHVHAPRLTELSFAAYCYLYHPMTLTIYC